MFNKFIRVVFNSSVLTSFILTVGISKIRIEKNITIGLVVVIISLALVVAQFIILRIAKK